MAISEVQFKYKIEMSYVNGSEVERLPSEAIKLLMIDYDFNNTDDIHAPIAAATLNIGTVLYNKMQANKTTAKILLKISKYKSTDKNPIPITYIEKQLKYSFPDSEVEVEINGESKDDGGSYREVSIAMIDTDDVDKNKVFKESIYKGINLMTIVALTYPNISFIIEPFDNNPTIDAYVPAMESCYKLIDYLNYNWGLYNKGYRFFQNWDGNTYILSYNGNSIDIGDGTFKSVKIKVSKQFDANQGNLQGMGINNESQVYQIEVDAKDTTTSINDTSGNTYNKLYCVLANGDVVERNLNIHNVKTTDKVKTMKLSTANSSIVENIAHMMEYSGTTFTFTKTSIDASIIVPYKAFMIELEEPYKSETGNYILSTKKETYAQDGDSFLCSVVASFKKIP